MGVGGWVAGGAWGGPEGGASVSLFYLLDAALLTIISVHFVSPPYYHYHIIYHP
jgi:hypothetical protein